MYHFRRAADMGNIEAREVVGEYFIGTSAPRKLRLADNDLQAFLGNMESLFSRKNYNNRNMLALQEIPLIETLDSSILDIENSHVEDHSRETVAAEISTQKTGPAQKIPCAPAASDSSELTWRVIPLSSVVILLLGILMGIFISYFL